MRLWQPWSLRELVEQLASGDTTSGAMVRRSRARVAETEPEVQAWVAYAPEAARTATGPLRGVPLGVKDIIDLTGFPTKCGSALRAGAVPAAKNAAIVDAWTRAGATPVGKTVTTEFAYFAPGPTRNPAEPGHTPGGSSSGSAAAVASGQVPLALGSQTAGSVTRPASFCGVASLVVSHGRFASDGVVGLSESLDSHGVFAATVSDLALAWSALTGGPDVGATARPAPRLLLWVGEPLGVVSDQMSAAVGATADRLRGAGAVVDTFPLASLVAEVTTAHPVVMAYEAARARAGELAHADRLSEQLAGLLRSGAGITEATYHDARATIAAAWAPLEAALVGYDAVLGPGAPGAAPPGLGTTGDPVLSRAWQALGLPAVGVPGLRDGAGLPLGLQVIGRGGNETGALAAACWVEAVLRA